VRHLTSAILGPVLGFAAYVLFGFGVGRTSIENGWTGDNAIGVLALVGAGVAYAILVVPRLSPIGPALAGIGYLLLGLWVISDVTSFVDTMRADLLGLDNAGFGPGAILVALSIPLLATLVSPNRWSSGRPRQAAPPPGFSPPPGGHAGSTPGGHAGPPPGQFGQPDQFSPPGQFEPPPFGGQPGYSGTPPIGAPYSGPPSYGPPPGGHAGPPPGSPVAPSGYDPYGTPSPGNPNDPLNPDVTRRLQ
jgi:hypothetical protein